MDRRKNDSATAALEDTMAAFIGAGTAVFVNSGEAAARLALQLAAEEVYGISVPACSGTKEDMADDIASGEYACYMENRGKNGAIGKGGVDGQATFSVRKRENITIGSGSAERRDDGMRSNGSLRGRRVFCPDLAPASLARAILCEGGEPVFIDISPCDWCMDPEALEIAFALYPDVKIVLMAHLYGFPGQIREIKDICIRHGALLIEDASDALGASIGGRMAGSFGDYGILDFGKGKIVSGDAGGMLLWNEESGALGVDMGEGATGTGATGCFTLKENVLSPAVMDAGAVKGIDATACASLRPENPSVGTAKRTRGRWRTDLPDPALPWTRHGRIGYSYGYARADFHAMADSLAKRILFELPHLPERIMRKKEIYENYREMLDGDLMYMNPVGAGTEPNYWMPCITCESAIPFQEYRSESGYSYANLICESGIPFHENRFEGGYSYTNPHGTSSPMEIYDALRASGIKSYPLYRPLSQQAAFRGCDQVSLDGSRYGGRGSGAATWQDGEGRGAENIENVQKADGVANMAHGIHAILYPSSRETDAKTLDGAPAPGIFWERCDWSSQISDTGLCLPSGPGMTREEQERVAEVIYSCFDAGAGVRKKLYSPILQHEIGDAGEFSCIMCDES